MILDSALARFNQLFHERLASHVILFRTTAFVNTRSLAVVGRAYASKLSFHLAIADLQARFERGLCLLFQPVLVLLDGDDAVQLLVHREDAGWVRAPVLLASWQNLHLNDGILIILVVVVFIFTNKELVLVYITFAKQVPCSF